MKRWPLPLRILFRFFFCYYLLDTGPSHGTVSLLEAVPGTSWISGPYVKFWDAIETWLAVHVFHLTGEPTTRFVTGSGDTTLDYIRLLCYVVLSLVGTLLWSVLDRRRLEYTRLYSWLRILVRYTLALTMLGYGFAKVFPLQFTTPRFARLLEPYSDFSPMGVLWSFMGASTAYVIFAGASEVLGGLLLFTRRTTTLGAMVCFAVLANVVALNYCYDVPVKLYSTNLLLMAVFLMAPDLRRLFAFLILNRATEPRDFSAPHFANPKLRWTVLACQVLFIGYFLFDQIHGGWQAYQATYRNAKHPPLYGIYQVEPSPTDQTRWRRVAIEFPASIAVRMMDDSPRSYAAKYDEAKNTVSLTYAKDTPIILNYSRPDPEHLDLTGPLTIHLKKLDPAKFLLFSRGFHWINERAFNR